MTDELLTYNEWRDRGYQVMAGMRAIYHEGKYKFSKSQVISFKELWEDSLYRECTNPND